MRHPPSSITLHSPAALVQSLCDRPLTAESTRCRPARVHGVHLIQKQDLEVWNVPCIVPFTRERRATAELTAPALRTRNKGEKYK